MRFRRRRKKKSSASNGPSVDRDRTLIAGCAYAATAYRNHHGRQRPMGEAALAAARARPSPGSGGRAPHGDGLRGNGRGVSDALRLLVGELEASARGGGRPDEPAAPV